MDCSTQTPLSFTVISQNLLRFMSIESVMLSNCLILCHPLLLLPSIFPSIKVFSNELALHVLWPKYWSFSISLSDKYSGLISFRIDWSDLLAVQGTPKSLLQYHNSNASILCCSAFFFFFFCSAFLMIQLTHSYMTTEKKWMHVYYVLASVLSSFFLLKTKIFLFARHLIGNHLTMGKCLCLNLGHPFWFSLNSLCIFWWIFLDNLAENRRYFLSWSMLHYGLKVH